MKPETKTGSSASPFSWFNGNHKPKPGLSSLQGTQILHEPGLVVVPIRSIAATTTKSENNNDLNSKITKVGEQKPSVKGCNQIASKALRPKQPKKKPSVPKKAKGPSTPEAKREKNNLLFDLSATNFDFSGVPSRTALV